MWAQLIQMQLKPGEDTSAMIEEIQAAEQPGSGLVQALILRDQQDSSQIYTLVVFESEEKARERENDPRRNERLKKARSIMANIFDGPPSFTNLEVISEWTDPKG